MFRPTRPAQSLTASTLFIENLCRDSREELVVSMPDATENIFCIGCHPSGFCQIEEMKKAQSYSRSILLLKLR